MKRTDATADFGSLESESSVYLTACFTHTDFENDADEVSEKTPSTQLPAAAKSERRLSFKRIDSW